MLLQDLWDGNSDAHRGCEAIPQGSTARNRRICPRLARAPLQTFQAIVPSAEMELPEKIAVERTVYWPWGASPRVSVYKSPLIYLREVY